MYYTHRHYYVTESDFDDTWFLKCGRGVVLRRFKSRYQANRFRCYLQNLLDDCRFGELANVHERLFRYNGISFKSLVNEFFIICRGH